MDESQKNETTGGQLELVLESFLPPIRRENSRYPALFTRVPLFTPVKDRSKDNSFDPAKPAIYQADGFKITRIGEGLSVYDEDTLIAILQLAAEKSIKGNPSAINQRLLPVPDTQPSLKPATVEGWTVEEVWIGNASPYMINAFLDRGTGGGQLKQCLESIKRLSRTVLVLSSDHVKRDRNMIFFELVNDHSEHGKAFVKINATMVHLLRDYAVIDVRIRKELTDVGKSLHRFLCGSAQEFVYSLEELQKHLGYKGSAADFKRALIGRKSTDSKPGLPNQLEILKEKGWLLDYRISGTGRSSPIVLWGKKAQPTLFLDQSGHNTTKVLAAE